MRNYLIVGFGCLLVGVGVGYLVFGSKTGLDGVDIARLRVENHEVDSVMTLNELLMAHREAVAQEVNAKEAESERWQVQADTMKGLTKRIENEKIAVGYRVVGMSDAAIGRYLSGYVIAYPDSVPHP